MTNPLSTVITWIKANKLSSFLLAIMAYSVISTYLANRPIPVPLGMAPPNPDVTTAGMAQNTLMTESGPSAKIALPISGGGGGPTASFTSADNRMTVQTTSMALKVNDVKSVGNQIETLAKAQGGWVVDSTIEAADSGSTNGIISIRVPTEKLTDTLTQIHSFGLRVVSEHVVGTDITDQYQNIAEQLKILEQTKQKLTTILASATKVQDMLDAQNNLLNIQQQIDSLQGQQKYLDQSAQLSLVTVYLATDELALPLSTPGQAWRPNLVFKEAVRALIGFGYKLGNLGIWLVVFIPVWLPLLLVYWWWKRRQIKH